MKNVIQFPDTNVIEEEASIWVVKFEGDNEPTDQDIESLREWMSQSPAHREALIRLASSWYGMDVLSELLIPTEHPKRSIFSRIKAVAHVNWPPILSLGVPSGRWVAVSMLLVCAFAGSSWFLYDQSGLEENFYVTAVGGQSSHKLQDGSTLWLNTDSRAEVVYTEDLRRIILHKGEAHFDVFPDKERPFEVYAASRLVRAVGTAFSVFVDTDLVKVTVSHGKVDLAVLRSDEQEVVDQAFTRKEDMDADAADVAKTAEDYELLGSLIAGQSVIIPPDPVAVMDDVLNIESQELSRDLSWLDGQLVFAGETLGYVVKEVSRYTSIKIEVADPEIESTRIGGQFQIGETDALFDVLQSGFGVRIDYLSDQHVLIHAKR